MTKTIDYDEDAESNDDPCLGWFYFTEARASPITIKHPQINYLIKVSSRSMLQAVCIIRAPLFSNFL